jgi:hypothetical protein
VDQPSARILNAQRSDTLLIWRDVFPPPPRPPGILYVARVVPGAKSARPSTKRRKQ